MSVQLRAKNESRRLTVVLQDEAATETRLDLAGFRVLKTSKSRVVEPAHNLFVFAMASTLERVAEVVTRANRRHELRALFVREDVDSRWLPQMFDRARLRTLRNTLVHSDVAVEPRRVLNAWRVGGEHKLIAGASLLDSTLMVVSCALDKYEVSFEAIPALRRIAEADRRHFEIADDGSYIHWPSADIHLDLDAFKIAIDPSYEDELRWQRAVHDRRYGAAIAQLRKSAKLRQSEVAGLSDRQVRRIERGGRTSVRALKLLSSAHGLDLGEYLSTLAKIVNVAPPDVESAAIGS